MRRIPLVLIIYLVVGVVVAFANDYFDNLSRTKQLLSALLAILLWPLVLVGFDVKVT
jgi:Mn2+/Fe2+ NRAMP family transporter